MNVREFVAESVFEIAAAISDVNKRFAEEGIPGKAMPAGANKVMPNGTTTYETVNDTQLVEFDIAVTAAKSDGDKMEKGGGFRLSVVSAGIGGEKSSESSESSVSRLKFSIPLQVPHAK